MPNNKIYLGNLNKAATEQSLRQHFEQYGEIAEVALPLDRKTKEPKGYGFITFALETAAQNALEHNQQSFLNKEIIVQLATEKGGKKQS